VEQSHLPQAAKSKLDCPGRADLPPPPGGPVRAEESEPGSNAPSGICEGQPLASKGNQKGRIGKARVKVQVAHSKGSWLETGCEEQTPQHFAGCTRAARPLLPDTGWAWENRHHSSGLLGMSSFASNSPPREGAQFQFMGTEKLRQGEADAPSHAARPMADLGVIGGLLGHRPGL
jgi:hypothetical protein